MKRLLYTCCFCCVVFIAAATSHISGDKSPLEVVELIGDKLIRETPFRYRLEPAVNKPTFSQVKSINFGRSFCFNQPAVAYAYTILDSPVAGDFEIELEHNDGCKIWLNDQLIYTRDTIRTIQLIIDERSIEMPYRVKLNLKQGKNKLLIKSQTTGNKDWCVYMQPPATKGAVLRECRDYPVFSPAAIPDVDAGIAKLTNWLVIGPFESGLDKQHAPEQGITFGFMYPGLENKPVTWTIPRIEVLGNVIDPKDWGTNYQWNYHNGGVALAMQALSEASGNPKYKAWATDFCEYHIKGKPFVEYQVKTLNEYESANHYFIQVPLLDFTLAPALPFIHKLIKEKDFPLENEYRQFVDRMLQYARHEQIRFPGTNVYTRTTPQQYTTWVDDMFMGIPFLVKASLYAENPQDKAFFIEDAAKMVLGFSRFVWDKDADLYMHANFSERSGVKLPHWSRANGWGIWATTEVLMHLDKKSQYYKPILEQYRRHVKSLIRLQAESGLWHNVLDRPDSPEEVSGTAIFTLAMARGVRFGWLSAASTKPVVLKAWEGLKTQIEPDGKVHKICMGTMCSEDVNYYINRPFYEDDTHGLFAVLFAGIEVHKMLEGKK